MGLVMKDISSLKNFQSTVEKKLFDLERALILQQTIPNSSNICNNETGNENGKSDFIFNLLENRIANLGDEISIKDAIIDHLTNQLFNISHNNKKNLQKDDDNNGKNNKSTHNKVSSQGNGESNDRKKVVVTGDSLLNGINERGLSRPHKVNIQNFPGGASETILEELDTLVASKPDCIIIHAGTNDLTNGINSLNSVKKNVKKVKQASANTKVVFSSLITRKDKIDLDKKVQDTNNRLKNYCAQTNIDFIDNNNIKQEHLGNKKLHLNKRGNTVFANSLLMYLRSSF